MRTTRADTASLIASKCVCGNRGLGVLGSDIPATGDQGASYLYNDLTLPDDANKQIRGLIVTPPATGTFFAYEDGSFEWQSAANGPTFDSFTYKLLVTEDTGAPIDEGNGLVNLGAVELTPLACDQANACTTGAVALAIPLAASNATQSAASATGAVQLAIPLTASNATQDATSGTGALGLAFSASNASQANASSTGAVALVIPLASDDDCVQEASSPTQAINVTGGSVTLLADDSVQDAASTDGAISFTNVTLAAASSAQDATSSLIIIGLTYELLADDSVQDATSDAAAVQLGQSMAAAACSQDNASTSEAVQLALFFSHVACAQSNICSVGAAFIAGSLATVNASQANSSASVAIGVAQQAATLPEQDAYTKRESDVVSIPFTFSDFNEAAGPLTYVARGDEGLTLDLSQADPGVPMLAVGGGKAGRVYRFGIEATSADGSDSEVKLRTMRLREPGLWADMQTPSEEPHRPTSNAYVKRPGQALDVLFDFRDYIATLGGASVVYSLRFEAGLGASQSEVSPGLVKVTLSGGKLGRVYEFGVEAATTDSSKSLVDARVVRIRESSNDASSSAVSVPVVVSDPGPFLVDALGNLLLNSNGQALF